MSEVILCCVFPLIIGAVIVAGIIYSIRNNMPGKGVPRLLAEPPIGDDDTEPIPDASPLLHALVNNDIARQERVWWLSDYGDKHAPESEWPN